MYLKDTRKCSFYLKIRPEIEHIVVESPKEKKTVNNITSKILDDVIVDIFNSVSKDELLAMEAREGLKYTYFSDLACEELALDFPIIFGQKMTQKTIKEVIVHPHSLRHETCSDTIVSTNFVIDFFIGDATPKFFDNADYRIEMFMAYLLSRNEIRRKCAELNIVYICHWSLDSIIKRIREVA